MDDFSKVLPCPECGKAPLPWYQKNSADQCLEVRVNCHNKCEGIEIGMSFPDFLSNEEINVRVVGRWNEFVREWQAPAVPHDNEGFDDASD